MLGDVSLYFYYFGMLYNYTNHNIYYIIGKSVKFAVLKVGDLKSSKLQIFLYFIKYRIFEFYLN